VRRGEAAPIAALALPALAGLICAADGPHWCIAADGSGCAAAAPGAAVADHLRPETPPVDPYRKGTGRRDE
jgi:hypothetical protein